MADSTQEDLTVLSDKDMTFFEQHGYFYLTNAFKRTDALAIQELIWSQMKEQGIDRDDRATWPNGSWQGVKDHPALEQGIAAPRFCGAIDQLIGADNWRIPYRWGGFAISFPTGVAQDWQLISKGWHWDDTLINHFGHRTTALFICMLFADIPAGGGGTLLASGSHRLIEQFYHRLPPADQRLKQKSLKRKFAQSQPWLQELTGLTNETAHRQQRFMKETANIDGVPVQVVEITGEAGDVYLCHPAIYHAASPNHADSPRFMRIKGMVKHADN